MQNEPSQDSDRTKCSDIQRSAKRALHQIVEPLAGFVLDSGLSASELHVIFREAVVKSAAAKQLETSDRVNISGIAATTGIPRAEISKILKSRAAETNDSDDSHRQSTNRILSAWHEDPKFTGSDGQPADLKIYGRGPTFETLARKYGRGIPVRAVLDELVRSGAVELLSTHSIRAKALIVVERGMSARVVKTFGERVSELMSTMLLNMRQPDSPKFIANISDASLATASLPLFRKELSSKGADFLADLQDALKRRPGTKVARTQARDLARISVTIVYHESLGKNKASPRATVKRRNFRREA